MPVRMLAKPCRFLAGAQRRTRSRAASSGAPSADARRHLEIPGMGTNSQRLGVPSMNMQRIEADAGRERRGPQGASDARSIERAAREAVARAWASGSFLIVYDTARRLAGADKDESRAELSDMAARIVIEECARAGVSMVFDARDAAERLRRDGTGAVLAL
jgi:hypothetical protein